MRKKDIIETEVKPQSDALLIDEFEIVELEDRLELAGRCNRECRNQIS